MFDQLFVNGEERRLLNLLEEKLQEFRIKDDDSLEAIFVAIYQTLDKHYLSEIRKFEDGLDNGDVKSVKEAYNEIERIFPFNPAHHLKLLRIQASSLMSLCPEVNYNKRR